MEGKQCLLLFLLFLTVLAATFSSRLQSPPNTRSKADDLGAEEKRGGRIKSSNSAAVPIVANLTECHPSFTDAARPIYCCPASWKDADQKIVDFQFPDPSSPMRTRRPIHLIDEEYKAKYERAVGIMRRLPDDHPHSYKRQANMHCIYCTGAYNQQNSSAVYKIHRSWLFFPWHRAYIYFHERILAKLIGDDNFALIYWSWDHPDGMWFPEMFRHGALTVTQRDPFHLDHAVDDNFNRVETNSSISDSEMILDNLALMYHQMISGARKPELFMGCKLRHGVAGFCSSKGTIESAPHNTVHSWVGSRSNPEREFMGAFYSAARDPIFFGHHAEIDRMWTVWKEMRGSQEPEFPEEDWLDTEFTFYDENVHLVRIKVRDVLDHTKLRYQYQHLELPWLTARPKPSVAPRIARSILKRRHAESLLRMPGSGGDDAYRPEQEGNWTLDKTITVKIDRPRTNRTQEEKDEEEEILFIYGIDTKRSPFARFDVFVNAVEETVLSPRWREFAGTFADLQQLSRSRNHRLEDVTELKTSLKLGITEVLEDLEADGDDSIWVTLVPRGDASVDTTVEGIRIEYLR